MSAAHAVRARKKLPAPRWSEEKGRTVDLQADQKQRPMSDSVSVTAFGETHGFVDTCDVVVPTNKESGTVRVVRKHEKELDAASKE